jgi:hypothetical protein
VNFERFTGGGAFIYSRKCQTLVSRPAEPGVYLSAIILTILSSIFLLDNSLGYIYRLPSWVVYYHGFLRSYNYLIQHIEYLPIFQKTYYFLIPHTKATR